MADGERIDGGASPYSEATSGGVSGAEGGDSPRVSVDEMDVAGQSGEEAARMLSPAEPHMEKLEEVPWPNYNSAEMDATTFLQTTFLDHMKANGKFTDGDVLVANHTIDSVRDMAIARYGTERRFWHPSVETFTAKLDGVIAGVRGEIGAQKSLHDIYAGLGALGIVLDDDVEENLPAIFAAVPQSRELLEQILGIVRNCSEGKITVTYRNEAVAEPIADFMMLMSDRVNNKKLVAAGIDDAVSGRIFSSVSTQLSAAFEPYTNSQNFTDLLVPTLKDAMGFARVQDDTFWVRLNGAEASYRDDLDAAGAQKNAKLVLQAKADLGAHLIDDDVKFWQPDGVPGVLVFGNCKVSECPTKEGGGVSPLVFDIQVGMAAGGTVKTGWAHFDSSPVELTADEGSAVSDMIQLALSKASSGMEDPLGDPAKFEGELRKDLAAKYGEIFNSERLGHLEGAVMEFVVDSRNANRAAQAAAQGLPYEPVSFESA